MLIPSVRWRVFPLWGRLASAQISAQCHNGPEVSRSKRTGKSWQPHDQRSKQWSRGVKSQVIIAANNLGQGVIPIHSEQIAGDSPDMSRRYPTVIQQALNNMRKFHHCVLLTRVGSFYELYFEQAETYGTLLGLKVAQKKTNAGNVSMAGFPFFQLERILKILVQDREKHVAISEEVLHESSSVPKPSGLLYDRQVQRIVTPGTLIDESFINPLEHNYLMAIYLWDPVKEKDRKDMLANVEVSAAQASVVGVAWLDISCGDFFVQSVDITAITSSVARVGPKEIVFSENSVSSSTEKLSTTLQAQNYTITTFDPGQDTRTIATWTPMLETALTDTVANALSDAEVVAGSLLLRYIKSQLPGLQVRLQAPVRQTSEDSMSIDKQTLNGLEVVRTAKESLYRGSLLHAVRRTCTEGGARLLHERLSTVSHYISYIVRMLIGVESPSLSIDLINDRLDLVTRFVKSPSLKETVTSLLRRTTDSQRLVQRFALGRGSADDLLALSNTIQLTQSIFNILSKSRDFEDPLTGCSDMSYAQIGNLEQILSRFSLTGPIEVAKLIAETIDIEGLSKQQRLNDIDSAEAFGTEQAFMNEGDQEEGSGERQNVKVVPKPDSHEDLRTTDTEIWIMKKSASGLLDMLHESLLSMREERRKLTDSLRERLGTPSLVLKWTPGLGYICHLKGKDTKAKINAMEHAKAVSSSRTTRSVQLPEWTQLGNRMEGVKNKIRGEEQRLFQSLRGHVIENLTSIRNNATLLSELDVACSFANLATEKGYVRPILNNSLRHNVVGGRHPMVESGLETSGRAFSTNDCFLGDGERVWLITGPNMAGKSTFLRQNALISILAQTGGYVPAEYAEIGIVDQIFSRIGSADNLSQDQSTFMVEMLETAQILRNATPRSFVIMDEVGRGTTPEDGIAVGYATLHHLHYVNRCRALFATHFHILSDMSQGFDSVGRYCTSAREDSNGGFAFVHRLTAGVNKNSHALSVARLAGMPEAVIENARSVLAASQKEAPSSKVHNAHIN